MNCYICNEPIKSNQSRVCDWIDNGAHYVHRKCMAKAQKPEAVKSNSSGLLSCKRWHEAEVLALKGYLADENADDSATAKSMRKNLRLKIAQHGRFIETLAAATT